MRYLARRSIRHMPTTKPDVTRILFQGLGVALLFSLAIDLHLTLKYGGVDLRDKVVGARSIVEGRSLYFDPWRPGEPERFADPMVPPGAEMTRYTGTPFQALVMAPLGALSFRQARLVWLFVQYGLLLLAIILAHRAFAMPGRDTVIATTAIAFVLLASTSWHLHVERGQVYVIFTFLIAALFSALAQNRMGMAGVLCTLLVLFKPTYAVMLLPLVLRLTWRMAAGAAGTIAGMVGLFALLPNGLRAWVEYRDAMTIWSGLIGRGEPPSMAPDAFVYPETIEGLANLGHHHPMEFENGSIGTILYAKGLLLPGWMPYAVLVAILLFAGLWYGRSLLRAGRAELLLLGFCCWTVLMMLLPVPRFDYQLVHWTAPVIFLLLTWRERSFNWNIALLLAAALVLGAWSLLPVNVLLAELVLLLAAFVQLHRRLRTATHPMPAPAS